MKKYIVEMSEATERDLENIISYLRYNLAGDIIADKYKLCNNINNMWKIYAIILMVSTW